MSPSIKPRWHVCHAHDINQIVYTLFSGIPTIGNAINSLHRTYCYVLSRNRNFRVDDRAICGIYIYMHNVNHFENLYSSILLRIITGNFVIIKFFVSLDICIYNHAHDIFVNIYHQCN